MNEHIGPHRIHRLSPQLSNQIAAGEVVERPASVVKELLENSLDAGANHIEVELEQGGTRLIRVHDDGNGIHHEDLALALHSHATSKISNQADLISITSMGFRGEALASIASVSRFQLISRTGADEHGWQVAGNGSDGEVSPVPAAHPVGTTMEVRELFYNTPARRKFLRTHRTEFIHVEEVVKRMALSHFNTGFVLRHEGKEVLKLSPATDMAAQEKRVHRVLGRNFLQNSLHVEFEASGLHLKGWLGQADYSRSQADIQYCFINGRIIRDRMMSHAIRQAFRDVLAPGRYPAYVLYLQLDPAQMDVNVHPTKHEVRFRETRLVHDFLFSTLHRALDDSRSNEVAETSVVTAIGPQQNAFPSSARTSHSGGRSGQAVFSRPVAEPWAHYAVATAAEERQWPLGRAVTQLQMDYLLAENSDGMLLLNIPTARAQLLLSRLRETLAAEGIRQQALLLPQRLKLTAEELRTSETCTEQCAELGFELDRLGPDSLVVRQVPSLLKEADTEQLVKILLEGVNEGNNTFSILEALAQQGACVQRPFPMAELNTLLRDVERMDLPASNGVWRQLDRDALAQLFNDSSSLRAKEKPPL